MNTQTFMDEILALPVNEAVALIASSDTATATAAIQGLSEHAKSVTENPLPRAKAVIDQVMAILVQLQCQHSQLARANALLECGLYYYRMGMSAKAIMGVELARELAMVLGDKPLTRRSCNMLGVFHLECLDFEAALIRLDEALLLARELNDRLLEIAALANISTVFLDMGLYREAIRINEQILSHRADNPKGQVLRLQCVTNNLKAALAMRDSKASRRFVSTGERIPNRFQLDPISAALFEYHRSYHLVRENQADSARRYVEEARAELGPNPNPRVATLLSMAAGICEVGTGRVDIGTTRLRTLYERTKTTRLYHDDVLRALIEAHERAGETTRALAHTEELIEYTTHAKKAKFFEQLAASSTTIRPRSVTHDELTHAEADAAVLRLQSVREMSSEYRTAENWAVVAELIDDATGQHCFRVGRMAGLLAQEIGCQPQLADHIEYAARLHDLGKIGISHSILLKPTKLSPHEMAVMRTHTAIGAELLEGADDPVLELAAQIARHHHEWWNGNGYSDGLSGDDIPLAARIVTLADVYDALTHERPYRSAWTHREAAAELQARRGAQFDPMLTSHFLNILDRLRSSGQSLDFQESHERESSLMAACSKVTSAMGLV